MVAVDAQILGGVAVTVLLALLFFGVVVLWDVALALRGVADKVDKLEDTLDDDLTDLERAVDGTAGGGGPQVHLSGGGTIAPGTAGAGVGQQAPGHRGGPTDGAVQGDDPAARAGRASADRRATADRAGEPNAGTAAADATDESGTNAADEPPDTEDTTADRASEQPARSRESIGADPTPVRDAPPADDDRSTADGTAADPRATAQDGSPASQERADSRTDETGSETEAVGSQRTHPRASASRGRFITSPDRTAWYRISLDREAIAEARSPIAGELEAGVPSRDRGGDEAEEPVEPRKPAGSNEEPIVVGPDGPDDTGSAAGSSDARSGTAAGEPGQFDPESGQEPSTTESADSDEPPEASGGRDPSAEPNSRSESPDGASEGGAVSDIEPDAATTPADAVADAGTDSRSNSEARSDGDAPTASPERDPPADSETVTPEPDPASDSETVTPEPDPASDSDVNGERDAAADGIDTADSPEDGANADPSATGTDSDVSASEAGTRSDETGAETDVSDPERASAESGTSDVDEPVAVDPVDPAPDEQEEAFEPDEGMEFTFEEFTPEDTPDPELTVDDAVKAVNDDTPSLSRSAHGVESRAELDDEGVVLIYDLEDSDSVGSTTRLLRYQLQSFAAESDADVDVTVSGNRVVVTIPGAEGADVSQWQSAIVEVIDRTLYLSDNSE